MQTEEWALVASVVFTGLWSGLLAMLTLVMHRMLAKMEFREFVQFLRAFLPVARRSPFNYAAIAGMIVAPVIALIAVGVPGDGVFVLTALGLVLTIAGPLLVSSRLTEPNYEVMLGWNPDGPPSDGWEGIRRRYFILNWVRAAATWAAFALFLAALLIVS